MKRILGILSLLLITFYINAQTLYIKAYGDKNKTPIIFVHGGPSGNATLFEATTAQKLADKGFYVIVYDRRGEGRSVDTTAKFTYQEAFNDLNGIYKQFNLQKADIIAHSFGSLVATLFAAKYPEKVHALVLAAGLFSQQETYSQILNSVNNIHTNKRDSAMLRKVNNVENLNKNSAEYRKVCYDLASDNGFFDMPKPTLESAQLRQAYEASIFYKTNVRNKNAPILFYKNEPLKNIDTKPELEKLKKQHVQIFAIYGKQDNVFSDAQMRDLKNLVDENNFKQIENCSHYLFVDQQMEFLDIVEKWLKH